MPANGVPKICGNAVVLLALEFIILDFKEKRRSARVERRRKRDERDGAWNWWWRCAFANALEMQCRRKFVIKLWHTASCTFAEVISRASVCVCVCSAHRRMNTEVTSLGDSRWQMAVNAMCICFDCINWSPFVGTTSPSSCRCSSSAAAVAHVRRIAQRTEKNTFFFLNNKTAQLRAEWASVCCVCV